MTEVCVGGWGTIDACKPLLRCSKPKIASQGLQWCSVRQKYQAQEWLQAGWSIRCECGQWKLRDSSRTGSKLQSKGRNKICPGHAFHAQGQFSLSCIPFSLRPPVRASLLNLQSVRPRRWFRRSESPRWRSPLRPSVRCNNNNTEKQQQIPTIIVCQYLQLPS